MTQNKIKQIEKLGAKKISFDGCARRTWHDGSIAVDWYEDRLISGVYAEIPATSSDYKRLCKMAK